VALVFEQPLREMITTKLFLGVKHSRRVRLTTSPLSVSRLSRKCRILDVSQLCWPPRPTKGIALLYFFYDEHLRRDADSESHWPLDGFLLDMKQACHHVNAFFGYCPLVYKVEIAVLSISRFRNSNGECWHDSVSYLVRILKCRLIRFSNEIGWMWHNLLSSRNSH
jgi:hypothetical protein